MIGFRDMPEGEDVQTGERLPTPCDTPQTIAEVILSPEQRREMDDRLSTQESELARMIQRSLLPEQLPLIPGFSIGAFCLTAAEAGGDIYDVIPAGPDRAMVLVADVMGSGLPAALFAAKLRTLIRTVCAWTLEPAAVLTRTNQLLFEELSTADTFITVQIALLDTRSFQLRLVNAGHCPLLLASPDAPVRVLAPEGMPIGILPDSTYEELTVPLSPSGLALMYTDGVVEASSAEGEAYGHERLERWLWQASRHEANALQLRQNFLAQLRTFQGTLKPKDDQTFVIIAPEPTPNAFAV